MDTARVKSSADRIARNQAALQWLENYGVKLVGSKKSDFELTFYPQLASACPGAKEAKEVVDAMARFRIEDIIQSAIKDCRNTIEIDRETIRSEASR